MVAHIQHHPRMLQKRKHNLLMGRPLLPLQPSYKHIFSRRCCCCGPQPVPTGLSAPAAASTALAFAKQALEQARLCCS